MKLKFTKMHGLGNDFVFLDGIKYKLPKVKKIAEFLSDRRFGIGADQVLVLTKSKKADFKMEIYNADGSQVEMCGNGLRCLAYYVFDEGYARSKTVSVETAKGIQKARQISKKDFQIDMGKPFLKAEEIPVKLKGSLVNQTINVQGQKVAVTCVSMGNPHCVIFVKDVKVAPVTTLGPKIENHPLFPERTNVEFVKVTDDRHLEMRVWERGSGETLACGSGACAVAVASILNGHTKNEMEIKLPGGILNLEWNKDTGHVLMTGPAERVFEGVIKL